MATAITTTEPTHRRLAPGLVTSWIALSIQAVSGFVIPRSIDQHLGQEVLGVWDFAWSMVMYFTLLDGGIASTVNRHVALYRAGRDIHGLNCLVSSVAMLQRGVAAIVFLLTVVLAAKGPISAPTVTADLRAEAAGLVLLLGTSISIGMAGSVYGGIVTGCHRWGVQHGIFVATSTVSLAGMCCMLWLHQGLLALAAVHFISELGGRIARATLAYRFCPGLEIRLRHAKLTVLCRMLRFGGKMFLSRVSNVILNQTANLLIAAYLGPAALALFSRPRSLVRQAALFGQKYANMLVPKAATLLAVKDRTALQQFVLHSNRQGLYLSLPPLAFLALAGGKVVSIWMGTAYASSSLIVILALGFLAEYAYQPLNTVLLALDLHGPPGLISLAAAAVSLLSTLFLLETGTRELPSVALSIVLPWSLAHGIAIPLYACRRLSIPFWTYMRFAWAKPVACLIPSTLVYISFTKLHSQDSRLAFINSSIAAGLVQLLVYWYFVLPHRRRESERTLRAPFRFLRRRDLGKSLRSSVCTDT